MFYVYIYKNPELTPLYVGKGIGNRALHHLKTAHKTKTQFAKVLFEMMQNGKTPHIEYLYVDSENAAYELERKLIREIGRQINKTGPLYNIAKGGNGGAGPRSDVTRDKISKKLLGIPKSEDTKSKMRGIPKSNNFVKTMKERTGMKNPASKVWLVRTPNGKEIKVESLHPFCIENDLIYPTLVKTLERGPAVKGKCKGWCVIKRID